jgi:hypothetical protein
MARSPYKHNKNRDRIYGFFAKRPDTIFTTGQVKHAIPDIDPAVINYWLTSGVEREVLVRVELGKYKHNTAETKNIDIVREKALALGKERVVQDPAIMFSPSTQAITAVESPKLITQAKRQMRNSIAGRMRNNPTIFTEDDIEFILAETKHLSMSELSAPLSVIASGTHG